jgi:nucleoside-diphosphate-sugar epimerase
MVLLQCMTMLAEPGPLAAYRGARVLVAGATGFVGGAVARTLAGCGADVWVVARDAKRLAEVAAACGGATLRPADLSRPGEFARVFAEARPAVVFNLAGYGVDHEERDPGLAAALNTQLPGEIAATVARDRGTSWSGMRLVHAGTAFEYGRVDGPVREDSPAAPISDYGRTKLAGTRLVLDARQVLGLPAAVVRLFIVYGPGEHATRLLPSLMKLAGSRESLSLTAGQQRRDFTFVGDVADGLLRLGLARECPGIVNLATGVQTSVREFAACAAELLGLAPAQLQFGALPYREDEVAQGPADISLLRLVLGWAPQYGVCEGIRETIRMKAEANAVAGKGRAG